MLSCVTVKQSPEHSVAALQPASPLKELAGLWGEGSMGRRGTSNLPNAVIRAQTDPLRDRAILLHLLREEELGAQRFVRGHFGWWLQAVV